MWPTGQGNSYIFVEGMGTLTTPTYSVSNWYFEDDAQLRCFTSKGIRPACLPHQRLTRPWDQPLGSYIALVDSFDNDMSCLLRIVSVANISQENAITIAPNPGNADIMLSIPVSVATVTIQISDYTGRILQKVTTSNRNTNIGQYLSTPGVYYYTLQDAATGQRYSGRFIFR